MLALCKMFSLRKKSKYEEKKNFAQINFITPSVSFGIFLDYLCIDNPRNSWNYIHRPQQPGLD